jgi:beta-N-acetylhexosaminidase
MKRIFLFLLLTTASFCFGQSNYNLDDFLSNNKQLEKDVDSIYNQLSINARVSQVLMPAVGRYGMTEDSIKMLIKNEKLGGVLLLNGTKTQFKNWVETFNALNANNGNLPFLYSADAEPSLVNRKMKGSTIVPKAYQIKTVEQVQHVAETISNDLNAVGINYNFSPVVDVSNNRTVGYRGFGSNPKNIIPFSNEFIRQSQSQNIIATAKHFPGHGLVSGDTHKSLQVINGELKEIHNYPPLIENGVLSIMVAHIAVKNNSQFSTNGAPATTSSAIVTDLLRDSLNFKGLIVTDAMNMGGVARVENAAVKAIDAGCDIVLMPLNILNDFEAIKTRCESDAEYKKKVEKASKRVIRMKLCLGLM